MRPLLLLAIAALLGGCEGQPPKQAIRGVKQDRLDKAEALVGKTPVPRTYRYPDAELRVLQIPVADRSGFVEQHQCFVWRDLEFKTSTISCGGAPDYLPTGTVTPN